MNSNSASQLSIVPSPALATPQNTSPKNVTPQGTSPNGSPPPLSSHNPVLYNRDCFEVFPDLAPQSVDALISDPPYGTTALGWDTPVDWTAFWEAATQVCRENAVIVLFAAQPFATDLINSNRTHFRYELIWHKTLAVGWLDAKRRPLRAHENILIFVRHPRRSVYFPQMESGYAPYKSHRQSQNNPHDNHSAPLNLTLASQAIASHYRRERTFASKPNRGERYPRSVLTFSNRQGPSLHPTQKPLALMEWLVKTYSPPGGVVLDPFMGCGTTGVACAHTGRHFIGMEKERAYFEVAKRRLALSPTGVSDMHSPK